MRLLERDEELVRLRTAWHDAVAGSGSIVLLAGESGIGKTSLAHAFAAELEGGQVLWGVCDPLGVPRPLGPLHDVAADLGAALPRLLASAAPLHEACGELLDLLTARSVLFVVDDLQWADEATIDLLRFVLRRASTTRSLLLGTYRADEADPAHPLRGLLGDVARTPAATRLDLEPLSIDAVRVMVGPRDIDPVRLHRLTRGNSFFVTEVVSQDGQSLPGTVRDAVLARAAGLDAQARDLADLLACVPGSIPDVLLPALGVGIVPLRTLDAVGLLARDRRGVTYRHDICRLAIREAIPPGGEVALHRRMISALETQPDPDPAVLAHHAHEAGDEERVLRYAARAGRVAAATGAHTEAARFFDTALAAVPETAVGDRAELAELLATELYLTDRLDAAIEVCHRAIAWRHDQGDDTGAGFGHQSLAVFEWYDGDRPRAEQDAADRRGAPRSGRRGRDGRAGGTGPGGARARVLYPGRLAVLDSDLPTARDRYDRAREIAKGLTDRSWRSGSR